MPARRSVGDLLGTLVRFGLAAVWLVSGAIKAAAPERTYLSVQAFRVLPDALAGPVAAVLPFVELGLGVLVLFGVGTRVVAALSCLVLLAFVAGITQAWARGLSIDCGCFGGGGDVAPGETRYPEELARDTGFLALAVWLLVRPRSLLSVDGWLGLGRPARDGDDGDDRDEPVPAES
ncbi:MauE/DoxX family redox-associated membrane protein [Streptoalloteichus hindustanus]|nr:MauE/DoxX family redox-associated membrane protein [Streptoalloteichus hindustanus]